MRYRLAMKLWFAALWATLAVIRAQQPPGALPLSGVVVLDTSAKRLPQSREVLRQVLGSASPQDEFALVQAGAHPVLMSGLTSHFDEIETLTGGSARSEGTSALLDAIYLAMNQMRKAHNPKKVLLVISDGGSDSSKYTEREIKNALSDDVIRVYSIGIYEPMASLRTSDQNGGPRLLREMAEVSGGRCFVAERTDALRDAAAQASLAMHAVQP
jgi:Ca-activated chloride channel homolog